MSTKVYSLGRGLVGIALLLTCASCVGGNFDIASIWQQSDEERFDDAMAERMDVPGPWSSRDTYREKKAETFHYAQEICGHFSAGNTSLFFSETDFGNYLSSVNLKDFKVFIFVSGLVRVAVVELCPENYAAMSSWQEEVIDARSGSDGSGSN